MTGRSSTETLRDLMSSLQRTVSCVTRGVLRSGRGSLDEAQLLTFVDDASRLNGVPLLLSMDHWFRGGETPGPSRWRGIRTVGYRYALLDANGRELISYHWHPAGRSNATYPHLHLGEGPLAHAHIPTGFVTLPDVVRLAIGGLSVRPRRSDWDNVLTQTLGALEATLPPRREP